MSDATYDKYHNDYVVGDKTFMEDFLKDKLSIQEMSDKDLENILDAIKTDISEKKTKIKDIEKDINPKNVEKSDKHVEAPRIEAKVKTN
jgi:predicted DNA-binding ArsR family transcriptional regulator